MHQFLLKSDLCSVCCLAYPYIHYNFQVKKIKLMWLISYFMLRYSRKGFFGKGFKPEVFDTGCCLFGCMQYVKANILFVSVRKNVNSFPEIVMFQSCCVTKHACKWVEI